MLSCLDPSSEYLVDGRLGFNTRAVAWLVGWREVYHYNASALCAPSFLVHNIERSRSVKSSSDAHMKSASSAPLVFRYGQDQLMQSDSDIYEKRGICSKLPGSSTVPSPLERNLQNLVLLKAPWHSPTECAPFSSLSWKGGEQKFIGFVAAYRFEDARMVLDWWRVESRVSWGNKDYGMCVKSSSFFTVPSSLYSTWKILFCSKRRNERRWCVPHSSFPLLKCQVRRTMCFVAAASWRSLCSFSIA